MMPPPAPMHWSCLWSCPTLNLGSPKKYLPLDFSWKTSSLSPYFASNLWCWFSAVFIREEFTRRNLEGKGLIATSNRKRYTTATLRADFHPWPPLTQSTTTSRFSPFIYFEILIGSVGDMPWHKPQHLKSSQCFWEVAKNSWVFKTETNTTTTKKTSSLTILVCSCRSREYVVIFFFTPVPLANCKWINLPPVLFLIVRCTPAGDRERTQDVWISLHSYKPQPVHKPESSWKVQMKNTKPYELQRGKKKTNSRHK